MSNNTNVDVSITLDTQAWTTLEAEIFNRALQVTEAIFNAVYKATPVDTGYLRSTTFYSYKLGDKEGVVGQTADYAPYVEWRQGYFSRAVDNVLSKVDSIWTGGS